MSVVEARRPAPSPRRRGRRAGWVALLLTVLTVLGLAGGWATKVDCLDSFRTPEGAVYLDWRDWRQYEQHCYSDVVPLYGVERLQEGDLPYRTSWTDDDGRLRYMEYPVVTGMLQYGVMRVTKWVVGTPEDVTRDPPEVVTYFTLMAAVLALAWLAAVACTVPLAARARDVALMALSPLVVVHAFTNFDTVAVAAACAGLLAWARGRPVAAGLLLGLGAAAKLYPLFLLGPLLVLGLRAGRSRPAWTATLAALVCWTVVNLPVALLYPQGWLEFFRLNSTRPADHDSIYAVLSTLTGWGGFDGPLAPGQAPQRLNLVSAALFALCCLAVAAVALTAPRRPRVASLAFLVVAAFLLTNKVWSPQYSLWLVPLGVLAYPRWLPLLAWMSVDAYAWWPRLGYFLGLADPSRGNSPQTFARVVLLRDALVLLVCALVVRSIYRPASDPVRAAGLDDPAGGPLEGAPDRWSLNGPRSRRSRRARTGPDPGPGVRSAA